MVLAESSIEPYRTSPLHVRVTGWRGRNVHMDSRNLELEFRMRMISHASEGLLQRPHPSLPFFSFVGSKILLQGSFEFLQKLSELGEALGSVNFSSLN